MKHRRYPEWGTILSPSTSPIMGPPTRIGAATELAASRKDEKSADIGGQYLFAPIAVVGTMNTSAR